VPAPAQEEIPMTQYLLSVHNDAGENTQAMAPEDMQAVFKAVDTFNQKVQDEGAWVFAGGLHPQDTATTVRAHTGDVLITDGPYAETKEYLGGFWIITAPDLDAALEWATQASVACNGAVEVRPFQEEPEA
jgi:hypothetical protein